MTSDPLSDARIVDSWGKNASPWTAAVRENQIASRTGNVLHYNRPEPCPNG